MLQTGAECKVVSCITKLAEQRASRLEWREGSSTLPLSCVYVLVVGYDGNWWSSTKG